MEKKPHVSAADFTELSTASLVDIQGELVNESFGGTDEVVKGNQSVLQAVARELKRRGVKSSRPHVKLGGR